MSIDPALLAAVTAEIVELHEFFVQWFAAGPDDRVDFRRCESAFDPGFTQIMPDGRIYICAEVVERVRAARGITDDTFRIAIEAIEPHWQAGDALLVTYVEAQQRDGKATRRRSTALFTRHAPAPNGVVWRHLHETWM